MNKYVKIFDLISQVKIKVIKIKKLGKKKIVMQC